MYGIKLFLNPSQTTVGRQKITHSGWNVQQNRYHCVVIPAWNDSRLGLSDSFGLWHEQVCFNKFLRPICWAQKVLKEAAVMQFWFHFASRKFANLCNFAPT